MSGGKSMYDELIADLRRHHCNAKEDDTQEVCDECPYDVIIADKSRPTGITSVCVCGLMNRAADALEELQKRVPKTSHGRLIDADAFLALINDSTILSDFLKCIINSLIRGEPTVIEAKEAKE